MLLPPRTPQIYGSAFDTSHVSLLSHLFVVGGTDYVADAGKRLLQLVKSDEKEKQCFAAEIVAAMCQYLVTGSFSLQSDVLARFVNPAIQQVLKDGNQDTVDMWKDAVACSMRATRETPRALASVIAQLAHQPFKRSLEAAVGEGDQSSKASSSSAEIYRHLRLLRAMLDECSFRVGDVGGWVVSRLREGDFLSHPYKLVRKEVGNILVSVTRASFVAHKRQHGSTGLTALVASLADGLKELATRNPTASSASPSTAEGGGGAAAGVGGEEDNKKTVSMANVAIQWMIPCSLFSQTVFFGELLLPLLPAILHLQSATSDPEAANRAKFLAITWAWGGWNLPVDGGEGGELLIAKLLKMLRKMSKDANWHVRKAVTSFLATVIPRHAFVLSKASSDQLEKDPLPALKTAKATIVNLLSDSQVEVREGAAKALQAMLSSLPGSGGVAGGMKMSKMTNKMYKKLYKMSRTVIPQFSAAKDEKMKEQRGIAINTRHGGLLGLSAFILSQPYAVPEWLPATLIGLAPHTRDAIPIGTTAKKLFQEFTRTHQDEWHLFEEKFTEDQLDTLRDCGSSLTYFA
eukprot:jgi/Bigna1/130913/aug1.12_g5621